MAEVKAYVDNTKRGRLLFLAVAISLTIFITKLTRSEDITSGLEVFSRGGIYFLITYVGLIWALRFQVGWRALVFILPQSALFVLSEVLFIELFFFRSLDRLYEAGILFILLAILFVGTYVSFLTANVFNVALFKELPLVQAGKTSSYILSLFTVYFLTFSLLSTGFPIYVILIGCAIAYTISVYSHIHHLRISDKLRWPGIISTVWMMLILLVSLMFYSPSHEIIALAPTVAMFAMIGLLINKDQESLTWLNIVEYLFALLFVLLIGFFL